jgi:porphobilinogen synthase
VHGEAGADVVAPSAMMDGQVAAIRGRLDDLGLCDTAIMSYSTKYKSCYYGPFRDAAHSAPGFGDRSSYQMAVGNRKEGVREALLDEAEGADWVMVKPGMPYLDVIREISDACRLPIAAYQVSGEYAMLKFAAAAGAIDEKGAVLESLMCFKRAGTDAIITYYAEEAAAWLGE